MESPDRKPTSTCKNCMSVFCKFIEVLHPPVCYGTMFSPWSKACTALHCLREAEDREFIHELKGDRMGAWQVIAPLVCNTTGSACTSSGKLISEQQNASFTDLSQGKLMHSPKSPPIFGSRKFLLLQDYPLRINVTSATKSKDG